MNPEKQRIAIAEACGWKNVDAGAGRVWGFTTRHKGTPSESDVCVDVPDYINDLDAIYNAIHILPSGLRDNTFTSILAMVCGFKAHGVESWSELHAGRFAVINATASQRAEAFLRTIGKWEEAK